jgi:hypothetical protein
MLISNNGSVFTARFSGEGYLCGVLCKSQDSGVLSWLAVYSVMVVGGQIREITLWTGFSMHEAEVTRLHFLSVFLQTVSGGIYATRFLISLFAVISRRDMAIISGCVSP